MLEKSYYLFSNFLFNTGHIIYFDF